jgi:hypothetical protein
MDEGPQSMKNLLPHSKLREWETVEDIAKSEEDFSVVDSVEMPRAKLKTMKFDLLMKK